MLFNSYLLVNMLPLFSQRHFYGSFKVLRDYNFSKKWAIAMTSMGEDANIYLLSQFSIEEHANCIY